MLSNNKAKDERIGVLEESKRDLDRQAAVAANVAAAASSHAATVETTARAATQQVLTGHARVESELAAAERRVEELERQRGDFQQLAAHMNQRCQEMKTEYEKVVQQLGLANAKGQNPSSCPECPRKQLAIEQSAVQIQTLSTEIAGLRGRLGILSAAVSSWEEKYNVEISQNAQLSREAADARNAVTRLTRQRDETAESLNLSQASLAEATAKVTTLQSRLGDAEARAARAAAEVMVYKDLPENVSALQQRFVDQRQQAQAVVDHLSESKNALAVQLTELQTYAQSLNNSITEKDGVINNVSNHNSSLVAELAAMKQKVAEDAQRITELASERDDLHRRCAGFAAGPVADPATVEARCADVLRSTADRYNAVIAERDKAWEIQMLELMSKTDYLEQIINHNMDAMAGGADPNGPSVEEVHENDWSGPAFLDGFGGQNWRRPSFR